VEGCVSSACAGVEAASCRPARHRDARETGRRAEKKKKTYIPIQIKKKKKKQK